VIAQQTAQARRRRAGIIGGFVGLSVLVVAAMVAMVFIQKSRALAQEKEHEAVIAQHAAEVAEQDATRQRDEAEKNLKERIAAEKQTAAITTAKNEVDTELTKSKEDLIIERDNATESAKAAQRAQLRAEASARIAERAQGEAQSAQAETAKANRELQAALKKEQDRVKELNDKLGSKPISDLKEFKKGTP